MAATTQRAERPSSLIKAPNNPELEHLLLPGTDTNKLVSALGTPASIQDVNAEESIWRYRLPSFPADGKMAGASIVGVQLSITNCCLESWGYSYIYAPQTKKKERLALGNTPQSNIKIFVVRTNQVAGGKFFDSAPFGKLGFIGTNPDMVIESVKDVTLEERQRSTAKDGARTPAFLNGDRSER